MQNARIIAGLINRLFLVSLIVAVLWVKGFLWWIFGIAIVLYVVDVLLNLPIPRRYQGEEEDEDEMEDADELDENSVVENNGEDKPPF